MTVATYGTAGLPIKVMRSASTLRRNNLLPADEVWLWQSTEPLASVMVGLDQARRGLVADWSSFTQFADPDNDAA